MSSEIYLRYEVECAHCGEALDVEVEPANMMVKITPCTACANKLADEYKENLREKVIALMLRDDAYSPVMADKVITELDEEAP